MTVQTHVVFHKQTAHAVMSWYTGIVVNHRVELSSNSDIYSDIDTQSDISVVFTVKKSDTKLKSSD